MQAELFRALLTTLAGLLVGFAAGCATPIVAAQPSDADDVLVARSYIEADYDAVWERFTQAPLYAAWYSAPCLAFAQEPGEAAVWGETEDQVLYRGTLKKIEKGRGLTHTFQFVGFDFDEPATPVSIDILDRGETVLVAVHHDCSGAPNTKGIITAVGWQKSLSRLKTLLETGRPMAWPGDSSN